MSLHFRMDASRLILLEIGGSSITAPEILESHGKRHPPGIHTVLSDYRAVTISATAAEIRMLAAALSALEDGQHLRWAMVAQDPVTFGILRMLSSFLDNSTVNLNVFRTLETAQEWLKMEGEMRAEMSG